jgi:hypothetical protein
LASCIAAAGTLSSCVDLDQEPRSFLTPETVVYDQKTIEIMANGLYKDLWYNNYGFNCRMQLLGLGADDIVAGSYTKRHSQVDMLNVTSGQHDSDDLIMWQNLYSVVRSANFMIKNVAASTDCTDAVKAPYLGEAYFMRAYAYFTLVRFFGPVPAILDPDCGEDMYGNTTGSIVRASVADIYNDIIVPDLLKAEELLPARARTSDNSRASRGAAKACLTDVYMTMAGWPLELGQPYYALARDKAKELIDHTDTKAYSLLSSYEDLWLEANKSDDTEHIFALNHDSNNSTASNYGRSYYAIEESSSAWSDYLADSCFYVRYPADTRKSFNFIASFKVEGSPRPMSYKSTSMHSPAINKYRDYTPLNASGTVTMTAQTNGITPIYRYAEVLLMYAEAQCKADGAPNALAYQCLNDVRRRAAGTASYTDVSGLSAEEFETAVFDERGWEFFAEFKRWFHLVRTGKVLEANQYNPRVKASIEANGLAGKDPKTYCWMPLPVQEVETCGFAQNEK